MPAYQITQIFKLGRNGWSETWYTEASSLAIAETRALNLTTARSQLIIFPAGIEAVRISDVAILDDANLPTTGFERFNKVLLGTQVEAVWSGYQVRFQSGPNYRRIMTMRGGADDWVKASDAGEQPEAQFAQFIRNFVQSLITNNMALRVNERGGNNPIHEIITLQRSANGYWQFGIPNLNLAAGDKFIAYKLDPETWPNARGQHEVRSVVAPNDYETFTLAPDVPNPYTGNATARKVQIIYPIIETGKPLRIGSRRTGGRFFVSAGRQ